MGLGIRIFLVNDDDSMRRLPLVRFEKLRRGDAEERLAQYAGKRVRYALVYLEMKERRPKEIIHIEYSYLPLDSEGRIDRAEREKQLRLAVDIVPPIKEERQSQQLVDAPHKFAKKRYDAQYKWKPSPEIEAAIFEAIFPYAMGE